MGRAAPAARVVSAAGGRAAADLRRGVGIGVLLAAALIAVALFLRTSAVETAPPDAAATDIAPGPIPEIAREAPAATPVQAVAVRLRLGPGQAEAQDNALRAAAQAAGHSVAVRRMPFPIARSRIEYYDAADRAAAQALARALAPVLKGPVEIRDLGGAADTTQGLDVWIAG